MRKIEQILAKLDDLDECARVRERRRRKGGVGESCSLLFVLSNMSPFSPFYTQLHSGLDSKRNAPHLLADRLKYEV